MDNSMDGNKKTLEMSSKKVAIYGVFLALALTASWLERFIPVPGGVPGVKLGLANIVTMIFLYILGFLPALILSLLRILLSGILFGSGISMVYSAAGALVSIAAMGIVRKTGWFSPTGVSVTGGVFHNLGQIMAAMILLSTQGLIYYLPILILSGLAAGILTGIVSGILIPRLTPSLRQMMMS